MVKGKDTVTKVTCEVCQNHQSRLRALRNFSRTFIDGIINGAIKKDTVVKHAKTDMHIKVIGIDISHNLLLTSTSQHPLAGLFVYILCGCDLETLVCVVCLLAVGFPPEGKRQIWVGDQY